MKRMDPVRTIDNAFFWDAAEAERLDIQACEACDVLWHPPRPMCPKCHSTELSPRTMSGKGKLYSWCMPIHPPAWGFEEPPIVALIDLDEGVRIVSNLVGVDPEAITNDMPVRVDFTETAKSKVPVFTATDAGGAK